MNYIIDLRFLELDLSPIWETGLWIPLPAMIASFIAMVAVWDGNLNGFELLGVDPCKPYKLIANTSGQENQPSSISIHGHGEEGNACRWEGIGTRSNGCIPIRDIS